MSFSTGRVLTFLDHTRGGLQLFLQEIGEGIQKLHLVKENHPPRPQGAF